MSITGLTTFLISWDYLTPRHPDGDRGPLRHPANKKAPTDTMDTDLRRYDENFYIIPRTTAAKPPYTPLSSRG